MMLEMKNVSKFFGGLSAVNDLSLEIKQGELVGLIGPNGAGKTTVFNLLTNFIEPTRGQICFNGKSITGWKPPRVVALGIRRTFQLTRNFGNLSMIENVLIGQHLHHDSSLLRVLLRSSSYRRKERVSYDRALENLKFAGIADKKDFLCKNVDHYTQKCLSLCMNLTQDLKLLLLDEPTAGMNEKETDAYLDLINKINQQGVAILLIEHNMRAIMKTCQRIVVLNFGQKIAEGVPSEIATNKEVIKAYLGEEDLAQA